MRSPSRVAIFCPKFYNLNSFATVAYRGSRAYSLRTLERAKPGAPGPRKFGRFYRGAGARCVNRSGEMKSTGPATAFRPRSGQSAEPPRKEKLVKRVIRWVATIASTLWRWALVGLEKFKARWVAARYGDRILYDLGKYIVSLMIAVVWGSSP